MGGESSELNLPNKRVTSKCYQDSGTGTIKVVDV
jgi:hypothetical protein